MDRYEMQVRLPEIGTEGQARLSTASVAVVGLGGLGSVAAGQLAAAGVRSLKLIDGDVVETSNLARQLYDLDDVAVSKAAATKERLIRQNSFVVPDPVCESLTRANVHRLLSGVGVVVAAVDNSQTVDVINGWCVDNETPMVWGAASGLSGQFAVLGGNDSNGDRRPCFRCLFPRLASGDNQCELGGVLTGVPAVIGATQSVATLGLLLETYVDHRHFVTYNAKTSVFDCFRFYRRTDCLVCGKDVKGRRLESQTDNEPRKWVNDVTVSEITPDELKVRIEGGADIVLVDVRESDEWGRCNLESYGARLIPLGDLEGELKTLDKTKETVIHCRSGARSAQAVKVLMGHGFGDVHNLKGGILAWAESVDPEMEIY